MKGEKKLKIFSGSTFIKKERLQEAGIYHPIKLEYYKIIHEDEIVKQEKAKYGMHIIKTEYKEPEIEIENKIIPHFSNDEKRTEEILKIMKENEVTPISVEEVLQDFSKK